MPELSSSLEHIAPDKAVLTVRRFGFEQLLFGRLSTGKRAIARISPDARQSQRIVAFLGLAAIAWFCYAFLSSNFLLGPTYIWLYGCCFLILLATAAWCSYFLSCRVEDLQRRIHDFDIVLMLISDDSRLFNDSQLRESIRGLEYRRLDLRSLPDRTWLAGRELAYLLGVSRSPSPALLQIAGGLLLLGLAMLPLALLAMKLLWIEDLLLLSNCAYMLFSAALLWACTLRLAGFIGVGILRSHIRYFDNRDARKHSA